MAEGTSPIQRAIHQLQTLMSNQDFYDDKTITQITDTFRSLSSSLTRQHKQEAKLQKATAINPNDREALLGLIRDIEGSPDFLSQLGSQQTNLLRTLHEIRAHVKEWEHKVQKAENDRSR